MNSLYIFCGESGSGKTTIQTMLQKQRGLTLLPSYTTRPKRYENEDNHTFVTDEEFNKLTDIIAYTEFDGHRYCGTSEQCQQFDMYTLDEAGIEFFKEHYKGNKTIKVIYIKTKFRDRYERMFERSKKDMGYYEEDITYDERLEIVKNASWTTCERLNNDTIAFKDIEYYADLVVENNADTRLMNVVDIIWQFIRKERGDED